MPRIKFHHKPAVDSANAQAPTSGDAEASTAAAVVAEATAPPASVQTTPTEASASAKPKPSSKTLSLLHSAALTIESTAPTPKKTPNVQVETVFAKEKQRRLTIRVKGKRYAINIPARLSKNSKKAEIAFRTGDGMGTNAAFGEFLADKFKLVVAKWRTIAAAQLWHEKDASKWKDTITRHWITKQKRQTRSRAKRQLKMASPAPQYAARKNDTITIQVPLFPELSQAPLSIRVSSKVYPAKSRNKPAVLISIPRQFFKDASRAKTFNMGVRFGVNKRWMEFIAQYLLYVVGSRLFVTVSRAKKWCQTAMGSFVELVNLVWADRGGNESPPRTWFIQRSQVPVDMMYVRNGWFKGKTRGMGLFTRVKGKHKYVFGGPDRVTRIVDKRKTKLTKLEKWYQAKVDPLDKNDHIVAIPTKEALGCGVIAVAFIVNHNRKNPTHRLRDESGPTLSTQKDQEVNTEVCFDYRYEDGESESEGESHSGTGGDMFGETSEEEGEGEEDEGSKVDV